MTEYWNEFRLASSEAELDDATEGEWLLMGISSILHNAWGGESDPYESVDTLARWAIEKEIKLTMILNLQKGRVSQTVTKQGSFYMTQSSES